MERSSGGQLCGIQFSAHSRNKKTILWVANPQHEEDDGGEDDDGAMINVFVLVKCTQSTTSHTCLQWQKGLGISLTPLFQKLIF